MKFQRTINEDKLSADTGSCQDYLSRTAANRGGQREKESQKNQWHQHDFMIYIYIYIYNVTRIFL